MAENNSQRTALAAAILRPTRGDGMARERAPKNVHVPEIVAGQKRQTSGDLHPHLHGQAVDDAVPVKSYAASKGNVPTHPGMVTKPVRDDKYRGTHDPQEGNRVLNEAADLGRGKKA
jgi:hypothetical protein